MLLIATSELKQTKAIEKNNNEIKKIFDENKLQTQEFRQLKEETKNQKNILESISSSLEDIKELIKFQNSIFEKYIKKGKNYLNLN